LTVTDPIEAKVRAALEATGVPYELIPCDPELADTAAFCAHYGYPEDRSANTIVVASRRPPGKVVACVALATTRLDVNGTIRRRLGVRKASFAPADTTVALTGMRIGGVTPFALPAEIPLLVDAAVMEPDWVILGGGSRSMKVKVDPVVFERLPSCTVVEGLAR